MNALVLRLSGDAIVEVDERSRRIVGDTLTIPLNAHDEAVPLKLSRRQRKDEAHWQVLLDTGDRTADGEQLIELGGTIGAASRSLVFCRGVEAKGTADAGDRDATVASDRPIPQPFATSSRSPHDPIRAAVGSSPPAAGQPAAALADRGPGAAARRLAHAARGISPSGSTRPSPE
jgi:hypothetical protein